VSLPCGDNPRGGGRLSSLIERRAVYLTQSNLCLCQLSGLEQIEQVHVFFIFRRESKVRKGGTEPEVREDQRMYRPF
jgi:hypothetical protein